MVKNYTNLVTAPYQKLLHHVMDKIESIFFS